MSAESYSKEKPQVHMTKKCPHCYAYLPLQATRCTACNKRVGEVDKLGFASKPFDWMGYLIAIVGIIAFCIFMWWGFFRE
jgi:phage FluMu protein Com